MTTVTSETDMNEGNYADILSQRTNAIYAILMNEEKGWDIEKAATKARQDARIMISDIIKRYNSMPVNAARAFHIAVNAWELARSNALGKVTQKITFAPDLEFTMKPIVMAYFEAGKELTERVLRELAEEVSGWQAADVEGKEGKEGGDGKAKSDVTSAKA